MLYSFEKSKISAWVTFNHNKSLTDSQEAISVVGTLSRFIVRKLVTIEFDLRLLGLLVAGCPFGAAPHAPTAAVVCTEQSKPLAEWPGALVIGSRSPASHIMGAYDPGPSRGCFQWSSDNYRCLLERVSCEPAEVGGNASALVYFVVSYINHQGKMCSLLLQGLTSLFCGHLLMGVIER